MNGRTVGRRVIQANNRQPSGLNVKLQKTPLSANPRLIERSNLILKNRQKLCTPRSDMIQTMGLQKLITSTYTADNYGEMSQLPDLNGVPANDYNEIMRKKLKECCRICNFSNPNADAQNKQIKTKYLAEIQEHIQTSRYFQLIETATFDTFFEMITKNIFRDLPPVPPLSKVPLMGDDIKDTLLEASWPHLDLVYQIFMRFLESQQLSVANHIKRFDDHFLTKFFGLFNTTDPREREALKNILHRLYMKFNQIRPKMRSIMQQIFFTFLYDTKFFNGINELLEFYISIINGFTVPIKPDNLKFLTQILIPLHGSDYYYQFQENLFYCIVQFVEKDSTLIPDIIHRMLRYWPNNSWKSLLFIAEMSTLIDSMTEEQFKSVMFEIFSTVTKCIESPSFQVSESAILLWKSDNFIMLVTQYAQHLFPQIIPSLCKAGKYHWNAAIKNIAISVLRICMQVSPGLYDQVYNALEEIEKLKNQKLYQEKGAWLELQQQAADFDPDIKFINSPYDIDNIFQYAPT